MSNKFSFFFCFLLLSPSFILGQNRLEMALKEFEQAPELRYASIGFAAIDIDKNELIASRNPEQSLITASTMKAITTSTTLALLGANHRFATYLEYDGYIKDGVLHGNLYFKGTGDPCLGSPYMDDIPSLDDLANEFCEAVRKAGIQKITGLIIGDGSYYDNSIMVPTWQWMDMGNHYGAGVSGLNLHDNLFYMRFQLSASQSRGPKFLGCEPEVPGLEVINELETGKPRSGDQSYIYTAPYHPQAWIRGSLPQGSKKFRVKGAAPNPELFAAHWLWRSLNAQGIRCLRQPVTHRNYKMAEKRRRFHTHYSPPLAQIIQHVNEASRNLYCESFLKTLGKKFKQEASTEAGIGVLMDFWQKRGVSTKGFFMQDGSGLSARNGVPAKTMAQIMRKVYIDQKSFPNFYNLLAVAGKTGTFKYLGRKTALEENLHGKGGSMNRVRSYTGYIKSRSGRRIAFSIIVNNYNCASWTIRKKLEKVLLAMAEYNQ